MLWMWGCHVRWFFTVFNRPTNSHTARHTKSTPCYFKLALHSILFEMDFVCIYCFIAHNQFSPQILYYINILMSKTTKNDWISNPHERKPRKSENLNCAMDIILALCWPPTFTALYLVCRLLRILLLGNRWIIPRLVIEMGGFDGYLT